MAITKKITIFLILKLFVSSAFSQYFIPNKKNTNNTICLCSKFNDNIFFDNTSIFSIVNNDTFKLDFSKINDLIIDCKIPHKILIFNNTTQNITLYNNTLGEITTLNLKELNFQNISFAFISNDRNIFLYDNVLHNIYKISFQGNTINTFKNNKLNNDILKIIESDNLFIVLDNNENISIYNKFLNLKLTKKYHNIKDIISYNNKIITLVDGNFIIYKYVKRTNELIEEKENIDNLLEINGSIYLGKKE